MLLQRAPNRTIGDCKLITICVCMYLTDSSMRRGRQDALDDRRTVSLSANPPYKHCKKLFLRHRFRLLSIAGSAEVVSALTSM